MSFDKIMHCGSLAFAIIIVVIVLVGGVVGAVNTIRTQGFWRTCRDFLESLAGMVVILFVIIGVMYAMGLLMHLLGIC